MFVGRKEQLTALSQLWSKRTSSLVTCRGRRRVGKSTLIEEFARRTADRFINIVGIPPRLGLERSMVLSASPYQRGAGKGVKGCQIDLLIQTERTVFVVEIKRRKEIGPGVMGEVKAKADALGVPRKLSIRSALVYERNLSPSVEAARYFDFIVDAKTLLES